MNNTHLATAEKIDLATATESSLDNSLKTAFVANDVMSVLNIVIEPANDEPFVAELFLSRGEGLADVADILAQDPEYVTECDRRRDAWLARVECEGDCDEE